jgi:hypothetical protein
MNKIAKLRQARIGFESDDDAFLFPSVYLEKMRCIKANC